ncbi:MULTISPECIES: hypothetical protein [Hymenobacter]|uniref:Lipoprotein n=1 Tax=Hymenobacter mucosus TaxID=1411120 RepID=A0A238WGU0_9BACT|nr:MULTISPECIES: hypothetical protein [Hymenobacter]SNR45785.1 hypothetical protein SAMN06269173_102595 [Hymenobacter mucosus]
MKTFSFFRLAAGALLLSAATFTTACSTGTDSGDTNVERGSNKEMAPVPQANTGADSTTAGLTTAQDTMPTGRQQYEASGDAADRNRDGIAD